MKLPLTLSAPLALACAALLPAVASAPAGAEKEQATGQIVMAGNTYRSGVAARRAKVFVANAASRGCRPVWVAPLTGDRSVYVAQDISADGRFAAFLNDGRPRQLRIVALDTRRVTRLNLGPKTVLVALSARGDRIAYGSGRRLVIARRDGSGRRVVATTPGVRAQYNSISWSPNDEWITFDVSTGGGREGAVFRTRIDVVKSSGGDRKTLAVEPNPYEFQPVPVWSPDSSMIALSGSSKGLVIVRRDGTGARTLAAGAGVHSVHWSPDGSLIAYTAVGQVFVMKADGSDRQRLTSTKPPPRGEEQRGSEMLAWSPDSTQIAYMRLFSLAVMQADGSGKRDICTPPRGANSAETVWRSR
jgi:Tol biopolymer transport system component